MNTCKISIVVPIHPMPHGDYFLWRNIQSILAQSFKDYEIIITQDGSMPQNTNAGMKKAKGELIKILYLDDYFAHEHALQRIIDNFGKDDMWMATGCVHEEYGSTKRYNPHLPKWTSNISTGNNQIGSPSVLVLRNKGKLLFDENLSWLLDCDLYYRYNEKYGKPNLLEDINVVIGIGAHQMTHQLSNQRKLQEHDYLTKKHA